MKNKIFKTLVVFGLSFIAWNCSDDPASSTSSDNTSEQQVVPTGKPMLEVDQHSWLLNTGTQTYLIVPNGTGTYLVTDAFSIPVGSYDVATKTIVDANGTPVVTNVDVATLAVVNPDKRISLPDGSKVSIDGKTVILLPGGIDPNAGTSAITANSSSSPVVGPVASSSSNAVKPAVSSSSQTVDPPKPASSSSKAPESGKIGSITYTGSLSQTVTKGNAISPVSFSGLKSEPSRQSWNAWFINNDNCKYDANAKTFTINGTVSKDFAVGKVEETWIMDGTAVTLTLNVTDGNSCETKKSSSSKQQDQPKSSSSKQQDQPKSSSAQAKSSSSTTNSQSVQLKYVSGGRSGSGFASRYWDCCKPHCSWPEHAHGNYSKQCTNKGTKESTDWSGGSVCSGGGLMTCTSQIPIIVNDSLAYAFAAVPAADGGSCGKCYALEFTGKGKYETKANHTKLKGKILVVMATNIGGDVQQGQFDVMIPGGGVGLFNGCSSMGWGNQGKQYGGLLSDCEDKLGNDAPLTKRPKCLQEACEKTFANDAKAKEGCMFLATWMMAAGNPTHTYKEVECPAALKAQY